MFQTIKLSHHFRSRTGIDYQLVFNFETRRVRLFKRMEGNKWDEIQSNVLESAGGDFYNRTTAANFMAEMNKTVEVVMDSVITEKLS